MHDDFTRTDTRPMRRVEETARDRNSTTGTAQALAEVDAIRTALVAMLASAPRALRLIVAQDLAEAEVRDRETPALKANAEAGAALRGLIEALG